MSLTFSLFPFLLSLSINIIHHGPKKVSEEDFMDFEEKIFGRFDSIANDLANMRETIIEALMTENSKKNSKSPCDKT